MNEEKEMSPKPSAFCSFDVETDGNNPLQYSMRSIGLALFDENQGLVDQFYVNIEPQKHEDGTVFPVDPYTMENFWDKYPDQWKMVNSNMLSPCQAMNDLASWLSHHIEVYNIKWVARPANFDWMWLKCYYEKYGPSNKPDIGFYCHDLTSLIRAYTLSNQVTDEKAFKTALSGNAPYTHHALDDAICQGYMYMNLRRLLYQKSCQINMFN